MCIINAYLHSMKKSKNPFNIHQSFDLNDLIIRDKELGLFHEYIANDQNVVVYGRRGIGKTTLLKVFFNELGKDKRYDTLYVDFLATQSIEEAIAVLTLAIYEKFGKHKAGFSPLFQAMFSQLGVSIDYHPYTGKPIISKGQKSFTMTEKSLTAIGHFLTSRKKPTLIALDNFQQISQYEDGNEEAVFRGWVQQFPSLSFIFIGSPPKMMTDMFAVKNRPFYNSAPMIKLDPVPLKAYAEFIQYHFSKKGKSISETQISKIYGLARGETYAVQLLCHHLFAKSKKDKEEEVELILSEVLQQNQSIYADFARLLSRNQWSLYKAIAKEEPLHNPMGKDFISKHQLGAASTVSTALKALLKLGLVINDNGAYHIHDVLIGRWMAKLL